MRPALCIALAAASAVLGTTLPAAADSVTSPGTNARYERVVTCATNSLTVRSNLAAATSSGVDLTISAFDGLGDLVDSLLFPLRATRSAVWVSSPAIATYATADAGIVSNLTPVGPPLSTLGCPNYQATAGLVYEPLEQFRILDTRPESRTGYGGGKPAAGALVPLLWKNAPAMNPNVSDMATKVRAVVVNLTATEATAAGYVQAVPIGLAAIGSSSNLNLERPGQTVANLAVVPVGAGGAISLFTQSGTHLVADLLGVFVEPITPTAPEGRFTGLDRPIRLLDTRPDTRVGWSGGKPAAGSTVDVRVDAAALPPSEHSKAAVLNVTLTEAAAPGFVTVYPAKENPRPNTSSLNADRTGQTVANLVIVPLPRFPDFTTRLYTQAGGHLLVDVIGVISSTSASPRSGGLFVPITPERVLDTRLESAVNWDISDTPGVIGGKPGANEMVTVYFDGLPADAAAAFVNLTGTEATLPGFVQGSAASTLVPGASSNLNLEAGQTVPNAAVVSLDEEVAAGFYTSGGTHLLADVAGFFTF
jgi:hypothetical protein